MKLEQYLRNEFATYIRPLLVKDRCENCGTTDNLELHHIKQFAETLQETLEDLELSYIEDVDQYNKKEFKLIKEIMLGKQLKQKYLTLCDKCHDEIEVKNFKNPSNIVIEFMLKHNDGSSPYNFYKCMQPSKALKYIEDEFNKGNMTLEDCMIEYSQISSLHPGYFRSKMTKEEKTKVDKIVKEILNDL